MRTIILTEHTEKCICDSNKYNSIKDNEDSIFRYRCFHYCSPSSIILFIDNEFIYFEYNDCFKGSYESLGDFVLRLLIDKAEKHHKKEYYSIEKSTCIDKEFKDYRLRNIAIREHHTEVNFIYFNNARKKYAITTEKPFLDVLKYNDKITEDYKKMKAWIKDNINDNEYLLDNLSSLHWDNSVSVSDYEIMKTTEHLSKSLTKKIKQL